MLMCNEVPSAQAMAFFLSMGLSLCKLIVEAHRGRLRVNRGEMGHTAFRFAIPAKADDA